MRPCRFRAAEGRENRRREGVGLSRGRCLASDELRPKHFASSREAAVAVPVLRPQRGEDVDTCMWTRPSAGSANCKARSVSPSSSSSRASASRCPPRAKRSRKTRGVRFWRPRFLFGAFESSVKTLADGRGRAAREPITSARNSGGEDITAEPCLDNCARRSLSSCAEPRSCGSPSPTRAGTDRASSPSSPTNRPRREPCARCEHRPVAETLRLVGQILEPRDA